MDLGRSRDADRVGEHDLVCVRRHAPGDEVEHAHPVDDALVGAPKAVEIVTVAFRPSACAAAITALAAAKPCSTDEPALRCWNVSLAANAAWTSVRPVVRSRS